MTKHLSLRGLIEGMSHEGVVPYRYRDSVGIDTAGVGHTKAAGGFDPASIPYGQEIPLDEVMRMYRDDARKYESRVAKAMDPDKTSQNEFDAGWSFDLNTGGINRANWVKSHNAGNKNLAAAQIMNWTTPPEITGRRRKEQQLYSRGIYSANGKITIFPADSRGRVMYNRGKTIDATPIAAKLQESAIHEDTGDSAKKIAQRTGTGGLIGGGTDTAVQQGNQSAPQTPDPTMIQDSSSLRIFLLILIGVLLLTAAIAGAIWLRSRLRGKNLLREAAELMHLAQAESKEDVGDYSHSVGIRGTDPQTDSTGAEVRERPIASAGHESGGGPRPDGGPEGT